MYGTTIHLVEPKEHLVEHFHFSTFTKQPKNEVMGGKIHSVNKYIYSDNRRNEKEDTRLLTHPNMTFFYAVTPHHGPVLWRTSNRAQRSTRTRRRTKTAGGNGTWRKSFCKRSKLSPVGSSVWMFGELCTVTHLV